jgi:hypothetical protein
MAIFSPAIARSRELVIAQSTKAVLHLVPELKTEEGEELNSRAFGVVIASVFGVGLLSLLLINTLLTQDAFVLQRLKHNVNVTNDQRDAILRQVAVKSSPQQLAENAAKMGMVPASSPKFIDISSQDVPAEVSQR